MMMMNECQLQNKPVQAQKNVLACCHAPASTKKKPEIFRGIWLPRYDERMKQAMQNPCVHAARLRTEQPMQNSTLVHDCHRQLFYTRTTCSVGVYIFIYIHIYKENTQEVAHASSITPQGKLPMTLKDYRNDMPRARTHLLALLVAVFAASLNAGAETTVGDGDGDGDGWQVRRRTTDRCCNCAFVA
jgi:hypothetical protein